MIVFLAGSQEKVTQDTIIAALDDLPISKLRELLVDLKKRLDESEGPLKEEVGDLLEQDSTGEIPWKKKAAKLLAENDSFIHTSALGRH